MLKLGVPSKGRLQKDTISWFEKRGLFLKRTGSEREYTGSITGVDGVELVLLSAGEIPKELAKGRIHLGVTGTDLAHEKLPLYETQIYVVEEMGFGFADLIIAVPNVWVDVNTLHDLDAVAAQFRLKHGFRLRIATKYHNLVRKGLREFGDRNQYQFQVQYHLKQLRNSFDSSYSDSKMPNGTCLPLLPLTTLRFHH